ncbi:MAG: hypothetical protein IPG64_10660 [Haliea sp.]|nr:hypothetical protein [Haliea sp.]
MHISIISLDQVSIATRASGLLNLASQPCTYEPASNRADWSTCGASEQHGDPTAKHLSAQIVGAVSHYLCCPQHWSG